MNTDIIVLNGIRYQRIARAVSMAEANAPVNWVNAKRLAQLTGLTLKAIDRRRQRQVWAEGVIWRKVDGCVYYSLRAYDEWAASRSTRASRSTETSSASGSSGMGSAVGNQRA